MPDQIERARGASISEAGTLLLCFLFETAVWAFVFLAVRVLSG